MKDKEIINLITDKVLAYKPKKVRKKRKKRKGKTIN
jgi:hypothetical protein